MDLLPPSVSSLPLLIFKALSEIHQSFLISNFGIEGQAKGQLILKGLFSILKFFPKTNETIQS